MATWFSIGALFVIACAAMIIPLFLKKKEKLQNPEKLVYQDQLLEINQDLDSGRLSQQEANLAASEIKRRIKRFEGLGSEKDLVVSKTKVGLSTVSSLVVILFLSSTLIYSHLGSPQKKDLPFNSRIISKKNPIDKDGLESQSPELSRLADKLATKLKTNPGDINGWMLLGRTYITLGRWDDASKAFAAAYKLSPAGESVAGSLAEALYMSNQKQFTKETTLLLERSLKINPKDPRSLFYWGLAMQKQNKHKMAIQSWVNLLSVSPPDAPWVQVVRDRMQQSVTASGININQISPNLEASASSSQDRTNNLPELKIPGPSREDIEAANEMSDEERSNFILSMVNRLAEKLKDNPNDIQGWQRLARAYEVLGQAQKAKDAWARVKSLKKNN
ncbi:MAG: c-type cytochrome biogenesis protein CcmI [Pseudomonadota bacterium]|nr:c-type cytochrome biogenesis protein CcmI [Pseudomonadota bacterium]